MLYYSCPDSGDCLFPDLLMHTRERESETRVGCCKDDLVASSQVRSSSFFFFP